MRKLLLLTITLTVLVTSRPVIAQDKIPTLFPSPSSYQFALIKGQLRPLISSVPDPAEVWGDPTASYFLQKSTWKELDFTDEQIDTIKEMKQARKKLYAKLGKQSNIFALKAKKPDGTTDRALYRELMKQNLASLREFNTNQEKQLRKIIPRHQWVQMSETITKYTLKAEGIASQITKSNFTEYLTLTEKQQRELKDVSKEIVKENDQKLREMAKKSVRKLMAVLTDSQKEKLLRAIGADDFSDFESINVVALNEQLRRFAFPKDNSTHAKKSGVPARNVSSKSKK